jgi:WD40 repeat protein
MMHQIGFLLISCLTPAAEPRCDLFGDPLPLGALARLGTIRLRTTQMFDHVALSHDGKMLVTSDYGSVCLWDVATRRLIHRFQDSNSELSPDFVAFANEGRQVVQISGSAVRYWTWQRLNCCANLSFHSIIRISECRAVLESAWTKSR